LARHEILRYEERLIAQPVFDKEMNPVGYLHQNDIVIVVGDEDRAMIQVMLLDGRRVWTRFVQNRLIRMVGGAL
jgi:hypothetical protein